MGRPKLETTKDKVIPIRFDLNDMETLRTKASELRVSVSTMIRIAAIRGLKHI